MQRELGSGHVSSPAKTFELSRALPHARYYSQQIEARYVCRQYMSRRRRRYLFQRVLQTTPDVLLSISLPENKFSSASVPYKQIRTNCLFRPHRLYIFYYPLRLQTFYIIPCIFDIVQFSVIRPKIDPPTPVFYLVIAFIFSWGQGGTEKSVTR